MLPDIGGTELLVIAAVALIVVGPKDLPVLLRKLGQFVGKMRGMAAEFRSSFDEMARQSELDDLRREVEAMRSGQYASPLREAADQAKDVGVDQVFADIDASLNEGTMQIHPHAGYQPPPNPALVPDTVAEAAAPKPRKPRAPKAAAQPAVEIAPKAAPRKRAVKADVAIETPKAARAPRKKVVKAGGSTSSDIAS